MSKGLTVKRACTALASGGVFFGILAGVNPEHPLINVLFTVLLVVITLIIVWFSGSTADLDVDRISRWKFWNVEYESRTKIRTHSKEPKKRKRKPPRMSPDPGNED